MLHKIEALFLTGNMINGASLFGRENSFTFYNKLKLCGSISRCARCNTKCHQEGMHHHSLPWGTW
jgi:hypothetical protein